MSASPILLQTLGNGVIVDEGGGPLNGHNVYVYERGTTTQVDVYTTTAMSTTMSQPLTTGSWVVPGSGQTVPAPGSIPGFIADPAVTGVDVDFYDATAGIRVPIYPVEPADIASGASLPASVVSGSPTGGAPAWAASTAYALNTLVTNGGSTYICLTAHTSGSTFAGESADWQAIGSGGSGGIATGEAVSGATASSLLVTDSSDNLASGPATASVVLSYATTVGDGTTTTFSVDHALGTTDVTVSVIDLTSGEIVYPTITVVDSDHVSVAFSVAPTANEMRVLVGRY